MSTYEVPFEATVSSFVTVEANNKEEAIEKAYDKGVPGLMHLNHTYPDVSDWEVPEWYEKEEEDGK